MQLSNIFSAGKQEQPVVMLCIVLTDASTQTVLLSLLGSHSTVISKSKRYHYLDANSLVVKTDEGLQELGPESEKINTVVFALEKGWIAAGVIQPKQQQLIDVLVKDLSLNPVGFIEQTETLTHALATQQSSGSSVLLLISQTTINAILVSQGKTLGEQSIGKSGDMVADVTEALARLRQQAGTLPPKLLCLSTLLTDEELETAQQELLAAEWQSTDFFLQQPSVEFLPEETVLAHLAQQAGVATHITTQTPVQADNFVPATAKSFGIPIPAAPLPESDFGFTDVAQPKDDAARHVIPAKLTHKPHPFIALGIVSGLVALVIFAVLGMYFWSSVVIYLTPVSKTVSREVEVGLDASVSASDAETLLIKAEQFEAEFTATQTTDASGVALVGEKAQGSVTLFNKTQEAKTFPAGTKLTTQELVFTLDEVVTVPAATVTTKEGGVGEVKDYGTKSVAVTAAAIGAEGNLAKATELGVDSFAGSTYSATSNEELTGGASREVRVVSATDLELLVSDAEQNIRDQATKQFAEQSGSGRYLLPPQQVVVTSTTTDKKEGTETDSVSTTVVATVKTLAYKTEDLLPIVEAVLQSEIPEGFVLKDREPKILSAANQTADLSKKLTLSVTISAQVVAEIEAAALRSKILGPSFEAAKNTLLANTKIQDVQIEIQPAILASIWKRIPKRVDRVTVQIIGDDRE